MVIGRGDETDLVLPLHDGVHEAELWSTFLQRLRRRVRADASAILVENGAGGAHWLTSPTGATPPPLTFGGERLRPGRVYAVERNGFGRVVRVAEPGGASVSLMIHRGGADFTAADGALLARLAPHLATALRTRAALDRQRDTADVVGEALRRAGIGWLGFAADGSLLVRSDDVVALAETVRPGSPVATAASACAQTGQWRVTGGGQPMLLVPVVAAPVVAAVATRVLGLLRLPHGGDGADQAAALQALFLLAPSEARLAAAILHGATMKEAAHMLGLTIETTRNYAKRVFAKTGTHGQVDLVRMLAGSVAPLL